MAKIAHVDIPHNFLMTKQIWQKICKSEMQKNEIFAHDLFYGAYHQGDKIERAYALAGTVLVLTDRLRPFCCYFQTST